MADRQTDRPKVGVSVLVTSARHPGCVLMGLRKGPAPGCGQYAVPGGHLEFGEEWRDCAERETLEETGLTLKNIQFRTLVNAVDKSTNYHYVDLFMQGEVDDDHRSEPQNVEPDKCEGWYWIEWNRLPPADRLFCALRLIKQTGFSPFSPPCGCQQHLYLS